MRRNARRPEFRSGIEEFDSFSAIFRMTHFAGTRRNLWVPSSLVRAPTTWSYVGSSSSIATSSGIRSFG